jgi:hypothetical protein
MLGWALALAARSTLNDAETGPQSVEVLNRFTDLLNVNGLMLKVLLTSTSFKPVAFKTTPTPVSTTPAAVSTADATAAGLESGERLRFRTLCTHQ